MKKQISGKNYSTLTTHQSSFREATNSVTLRRKTGNARQQTAKLAELVTDHRKEPRPEKLCNRTATKGPRTSRRPPFSFL
ncbi:Hypothetical protein NTJ_08172 [Nesidiocoris tenuis]|uniref:Uncharacterized protein n=1 Tax=Nesidiocoris tenuis TaxID=355587 RepID=A0ABN7AXY9_9HEMI|nr:Hypothetical protein NTJ_08172 [Nesidiocoris tenuis]